MNKQYRGLKTQSKSPVGRKDIQETIIGDLEMTVVPTVGLKYILKGMCARHLAKSAITVSDLTILQSFVDLRKPGTIAIRNQAALIVKRTAETEIDSSDKDFLTKSVAHIRIKMVKKRYGFEKTIPLMLNDVHIWAEPDTGADVNVMDEYQ